MPEELAGCEVTESELMSNLERLREFLKPFGACLVRTEQRKALEVNVGGRLRRLERRTLEPIADDAGASIRAIQRFVGSGPWSPERMISVLRKMIVEELGDSGGVLIVDPSGFPKKGNESVGVARQWCGRLGKVENSQKGVFLSYASARGFSLVDGELYLPREWSENGERRARCCIPENARFRTCEEIALALILRALGMPHSWVAGDSEFGRAAWFRRSLALINERYILDVPSNHRAIFNDPTPWLSGWPRAVPAPMQLRDWVRTQDRRSWAQFVVREGAKGPIRVRATVVPVTTREPDGEFETRERLLIMEPIGRPKERRYLLTNADESVPLETLARTAASRHHIEEGLETAKGDVGLDEYEVRSWPGWYHHVAICLIAAFFLTHERTRLGEKSAGHNGLAGPEGDLPDARAAPDPGRDRRVHYPPTSAQRGIALRPLASSCSPSAAEARPRQRAAG